MKTNEVMTIETWYGLRLLEGGREVGKEGGREEIERERGEG